MPKISDSPLECDKRKGDKCSSEPSPRCDKDYIGTCCAFCPNRTKCWDVCPKVMSYFHMNKVLKTKLSKSEKKQLKEGSMQVDFRIIGNPSKRKIEEKDIKEDEETPSQIP